MTTRKRHIDDEQPKTVEEHFKIILADDTYIDSTHSKVTPDDLPEWFDEELFIEGQKYYQRNMLGIGSANLAGLVAVFLVPSISKILMFTKQSATPCTAFKRYFETLLHIYVLHTHNVMDPHSKFYKSLNTIKWKHSMSSKRSIDNNNPGITQRDMVLTQFCFIGYVLVCPELLSLTDEVRERQGFNHFWRVIGHLLGIPDRLNLCRRNEYETTLLCNMIRDEVYRKALKAPNEDFIHLTTVAINGLACVDPVIDLDAFLSFFYDINGSKYEKKISLYSELNYLYRKSIFYLIGTPMIGRFVRSFWNAYLRLAYWLHEKYPIIAWMKFGKDNIKVKLYPHSAF